MLLHVFIVKYILVTALHIEIEVLKTGEYVSRVRIQKSFLLLLKWLI